MIPPILLRLDVTGLRYLDGASDINMTRTYNGRLMSFIFPASFRSRDSHGVTRVMLDVLPSTLHRALELQCVETNTI
jgi:hypothetical protein